MNDYVFTYHMKNGFNGVEIISAPTKFVAEGSFLYQHQDIIDYVVENCNSLTAAEMELRCII